MKLLSGSLEEVRYDGNEMNELNEWNITHDKIWQNCMPLLSNNMTNISMGQTNNSVRVVCLQNPDIILYSWEPMSAAFGFTRFILRYGYSNLIDIWYRVHF